MIFTIRSMIFPLNSRIFFSKFKNPGNTFAGGKQCWKKPVISAITFISFSNDGYSHYASKWCYRSEGLTWRDTRSTRQLPQRCSWGWDCARTKLVSQEYLKRIRRRLFFVHLHIEWKMVLVLLRYPILSSWVGMTSFNWKPFEDHRIENRDKSIPGIILFGFDGLKRKGPHNDQWVHRAQKCKRKTFFG